MLVCHCSQSSGVVPKYASRLTVLLSLINYGTLSFCSFGHTTELIDLID